MCERLGKTFEMAALSDEGEVDRVYGDARKTLDRSREQLQELRHRRRELLQRAGQSDLKHDAVVERIRAIEEQKQTLELELAGHRARHEALQEQVARTSAELDGHMRKAHEVTEQLRIVEALRKQRVDMTAALVAAATVPQHESIKASEALALARADLARHEQEVERHTHDQLAGLNNELRMLQTEIVGTEARLGILNERFEKVEKADLLELADQYEAIEFEITLTQESVVEATRRVAEIERQRRTLRKPTVTILGGK